MKYDKVIRLAREAGFTLQRDEWLFTEMLQRFAALVELATLEGLSEKTTGNLVHIKLNVLKTALENIAGVRPVVDNLLSDRDIAIIALERINRYET